MSAVEKTLEQYLRDAAQRGIIDHTLRVTPGGLVKFYIHPAGADGETLDFVVGGNGLSCVGVAQDTATAIGPTNAS